MEAQRRLADVKAKTSRDRVQLEAEKNNNRRLEVIETLYGGLRQKMKKKSKWPGAAAVVASGQGQGADAAHNDDDDSDEAYAEIKTPADDVDGAAASVAATHKPTKTTQAGATSSGTSKIKAKQDTNASVATTKPTTFANTKQPSKLTSQVATGKTSSQSNASNQQQQPSVYIVSPPAPQQPSHVLVHQVTSPTPAAILEPTLYAPLPQVAQVPNVYVTQVPASPAVNQPVLATPIATPTASIVTYPHHVYYASQSAPATVGAGAAPPLAVPVAVPQPQAQVVQPQVAIPMPAIPLATTEPYSLMYMGRSLPQPPTTYVPVTAVPTTNYVGIRY